MSSIIHTSDDHAVLDADELLHKARGATGLDDFGDPWFLTPLRKLVEFINTEGRLRSADCQPVENILNKLIARLEMVDFVKKHPEVHDEPIDVAAIIIGQARGGSTLLHRLLTTCSKITAMHTWELHAPVPPRSGSGDDLAARIKVGQDWIDAIHADLPDLKAVHPLDVFAYDEEILLIETSFVCILYFYFFNIPSYRRWLLEQDHAPVYSELKLWLQILQYQSPERRAQKWILKSPQHLLGGGLRALIDAFPDTRVVMTHRDMKKVIGSNANISNMQISTYSDGFVKANTGPEFAELFQRAFTLYEDAKREFGEDLFIDVKYDELLADPVGQYKTVMEDLGIQVTGADIQTVRTWIEDHPRTTHPPHNYVIEEFGLTDSQVDAAFFDYRSRYMDG